MRRNLGAGVFDDVAALGTRWAADAAERTEDTGPRFLCAPRRIYLGDRPGELEVWPESHWPGFALRQADAFQSYTAW